MFIAAAIGAVVGAVVGGCVAAANGDSVLEGALIGAAIGGVVGLGAGAIASVVTTGTITASSTAVVSSVTGSATTTGVASLGTGATTVYISRSVDKVVQYIGITNNFARRALEHLAQKGIHIEELITDMSRYDARAVEQCLIEYYQLEKNGGTLINKINSISPNNPIYSESVRRGWEILNKLGIL